MYPAGAVLLLAELDRAMSDNRFRVQITKPRDIIVDEVLQQIGIYQRLGIPCAAPPNHESVIHWRSATGVVADTPTSGQIVLQYQGRLAQGISSGLYRGITEAMTNTIHHAYDGSEGEKLRHGMGRKWWMLSQEKDGKLTVAIGDLGIGIPKSLPRSKTFTLTDIRSLWSRLKLDKKDGSAIQIALELGKTRTNLQGRGKGLADIVQAVSRSPEGIVQIYSNKGSFASEDGKGYAHSHPSSIRGTLISWQVPIAE